MQLCTASEGHKKKWERQHNVRRLIMDRIPLVSIGLPVYNAEKTVGRAIESLIAQDYENIEIIISDNASTDLTRDICRKYMAENPVIRFNHNEKNLGVSQNHRIVLNMAKGEYFVWTADDDIRSPEFIRILANELESHPDAGVAMCATNRIKSDGTLSDCLRFNGANNPNNKSFLEMATLLAAPPLKYNLFICGVFRTNLLRQTMALYADEIIHERLLLCLVALSAKFRYVDQAFFTKTVYITNKRDWRSSDPVFGNRKKKKFKKLKWILALSVAVLKMPSIPWYRKFYVVGPISYKLKRKLTKISFKAALLNKVRSFLTN